MRLARSINPGRRGRWLLATVSLSVGLAIAVPLAHYGGLYLDNPLRPSLRSARAWTALPPMLAAVPAFYRNAVGQGPDIERLELEIDAGGQRRIAERRAEALRVGVLFASRADLVPATFRQRGRALDARVRLKGDLRDHWVGRRWSLRGEITNGELLGMRRFSLHAPWTRGFHREAVFFDVLRRHGVLAPRAEIVELVFGGRRLGLMELEQHVGSELVGTGRGIFLRLDEDGLWREWVATAERLGVPWSLDVPKPRHADDWRTARIDAFESKEIRASAELSRHHDRAVELLRSAQAGSRPLSEVFDVEPWGTFLAHCEIFGAVHMALWNNLRFYYDPEARRLQPVAFDTGVLPERARLPASTVRLDCVGGELALTSALVADPAIRAAFVAALRRLDDQVRDPRFEAFLRERKQRYLAPLRTEYPWLEPFDLAAARRRAEALRGVEGSDVLRQSSRGR